MGQAVRGGAGIGGGWRGAAAGVVTLALVAAPARAQDGAERIDLGRFTVVAYPPDVPLAQSLVSAAVKNDTFPGLPRPRAHVLIAIAPDRARFREWVGSGAPEWGAAIAIPDEGRIVLQGRGAPSSAGDPSVALRHELAHLALHEYLGTVRPPPRWFDEGYACFAAPELGRDDLLAANIALAFRGVPSLAALDTGLTGGVAEADVSYALAYRAVSDLASLDSSRGLTLFFQYWRDTGSLDQAMRRAYGLPLEVYEVQWRARVRRRYGVLALVSDLTVLTLLFLAILAPLYVARVRRDRRRLAALRAADVEAERRARQEAIDALLDSIR